MAAFRDSNLSRDEALEVVKKPHKSLPRLELEHLPGVIYQLLLFSAKGFQADVLRGIASHFQELDRKYRPTDDDATQVRRSKLEVLRAVEGNILLHIDFAMKRDPSLASAYLAILKGGQFVVYALSLALLFLLTRGPFQARFEAQVGRSFPAIDHLRFSPS